MASSSSSKRYNNVARIERNASPTKWIISDASRNRFICWRKIKEVVPYKSIDMSLFSGEGFLFPNRLTHQGLAEFVKMKGVCYLELKCFTIIFKS